MAEKQNDNKMGANSSENLIGKVYSGSDESTFYLSPQVPKSYKQPYNSDDLWQKSGDYSIYERMVNDDQVSICLQLKKDLILGSGYSLFTEDDEQQEMAKEIMGYLEDDTDDPFEDKVEEILSAYDFGLSLTEKIFQVRDDNKLCLKDLKTRAPNSFLLHQDDKGNVTRYQQYGPKGYVDINPECLIHYINNKRFQNPYGTSDLRAAYAAWFAKCEVIKYLGIFVEGVAKPIPVGTYSQNAPVGTATTLLNILKTFQAKTALVIPKEVEIDFLQTTNTGEAYHKAINLFNMFIGRSLFIPDLMGMSGSETGGGSFALGDKQINVFFMHINRRRKAIEKIINKHIIWPIILWNYGNIPDYPKFRFNPLDDKDSVELAKTWLEAVKGKTWKASESEIRHFQKLVKFPETDGVEYVDDEPMDPSLNPNIEAAEMGEAGKPVVQSGSKLPADGQKVADTALNGAQVTALVEIVQNVAAGLLPRDSALALIQSAFLVDATEANKILGTAGKGFIPKNILEDNRAEAEAKAPKQELPEKKEKPKEFAKVFDYPSGDYHKKCDFKAIAAKLDDYDGSVLAEAKPIIKKIYADLFDQLQRKNIIGTKKLERADSLNVKYLADLKKVLKSSFMGIYKDGQIQAQGEILKSNFRAPTTSQEFLDILEQETFTFIGDYRYQILKRVKTELAAAIKDGRPLSTVLDVLDLDGKRLTEDSLERFARTKHTEVLNRGRLEFFNESGVVTGYQYSAILDDRTSEICRGLHGKKFKAGEEPIPPMHYNCRSVLIPITKYEAFEPSETVGKTPINEFIDENVGTGFAVK